MWAYRLHDPGCFAAVEVSKPSRDDLLDGEVIIRFRAGGICGSDIPKFRGLVDSEQPYNGETGFPLHEIIGDVIETAGQTEFEIGDRVVGLAHQSRGLRECFANPATLLSRAPPELSDVAATVIQPVATVLNALDQVPDVQDKRVAVIGLGPLGLLFTHVLKSRGAIVIGVDRVDREDVAEVFGVDELVTSPSDRWVSSLSEAERPAVCIEAVGHQQGTLTDAILATARGGSVFAFGVPDDEQYVFPFQSLFRSNITLRGGVTQDWPRFLAAAADYVVECQDSLSRYVTHVIPVADVEKAFYFYGNPARGRLKVVLTSEKELERLDA